MSLLRREKPHSQSWFQITGRSCIIILLMIRKRHNVFWKTSTGYIRLFVKDIESVIQTKEAPRHYPGLWSRGLISSLLFDFIWRRGPCRCCFLNDFCKVFLRRFLKRPFWLYWHAFGRKISAVTVPIGNQQKSLHPQACLLKHLVLPDCHIYDVGVKRFPTDPL